MFPIMAGKLTKFKQDMQEARSKVIYVILVYPIINIFFRIFDVEISESTSCCFNIKKSNITSFFNHGINHIIQCFRIFDV